MQQHKLVRCFGSIQAKAFVVGVLVCVLCAVVTPFVLRRKSHHAALRRMTCKNNLCYLVVRARGIYPHPTTPQNIMHPDTQEPLLSWRAGMDGNLYDRFDLQQRWDSPANLQLVKKMPSLFSCPEALSSRASGYTSYVMLLRNGNLAYTYNGELILFIETDSKIEWTKPEDLDFATLGEVRNHMRNHMRKRHMDGFYICLGNGEIRIVRDPNDIDIIAK
jgi:hypothetical protein